MTDTIVTAAAEGPSAWVVGLIAALLGSAMTLAGEWFLQSRGQRRRTDALRAQLFSEVTTIFEYAAARAGGSSDVLQIEPPLPSAAWQVLVASGLTGRLPSPLLSRLTDLYVDVNAANHRASVVPLLLQTSTLAGDSETRAAFRAEARRMSTAPYATVLSHKGDVLSLLATNPTES